jgi:hypothetical protein
MDRQVSPAAADVVDESVDVIVLGAGISGLVAASVLLQQGNTLVAVVDGYPHVGGNHIDREHNGYTFDVGSLIFQDDSPLLQHFPEILPRYTPITPTWSRLNPQGMITQYPFSIRDDLVGTGPAECARILLSAAHGRLFRRRLRNARDFARHWLGARLLHRSGLERYMERFCGLPAERIDLKFAEKRMLWIAEYASIPNLLRRMATSFTRPAALRPTNRQLARPREGFAHLYTPAVTRLTERGVTFRLGADLKRLSKADGVFRLETGDGSIEAARVISTIPIDHARELCELPVDGSLPTVTLISLFFSFSGDRGFVSSILYNFAHSGAWKRLTMYSDFYGRVDGREYFGVEVVANEAVDDVPSAEHDFRRHTSASGLFGGDLRLEGSYTLANAYPIYTEGAGDRAEAAIAALREWGVESFGRQGGFQYQPTARVSTNEAEAALTDPARPVAAHDAERSATAEAD